MNNTSSSTTEHIIPYLDSGVIGDTWWMGIKVLKVPMDMWLYQEIIHNHAPDVIIETGTYNGGSALFMAQVCENLNRGRIITIDIVKRKFPEHKRIEYVNASSISEDTVKQVKQMIKPGEKVMVILDANHDEDFVDQELKLWSPIVTKGQYLVVEDTVLCYKQTGADGPYDSVKKFMSDNKEFVIDESKHKFMISSNMCGFLYKHSQEVK